MQTLSDGNLSKLIELRTKYPKNVFIAHLNINSIRNKFQYVESFILHKIDILLLSETKIDNSFPDSQFYLKNYRMFRKDRNQKGGGIIIYISEEVLCRNLNIFSNQLLMEVVSIEINLRKEKILIIGLYKPPSQCRIEFLLNLKNGILPIIQNYDKIIIFGDFNMTVENSDLSSFMDIFELDSLITKPTCYKNLNNPSCIDLILTNCKHSFLHSATIETGISDFHKLTLSIMRTHINKAPPKTLKYRFYKNFNKDYFESEIYEKTKEINDFDEFQNIFKNIFNENAPLKTKALRANNKPFMDKILRKNIMTRSKLKNIFNKTNNMEDWSAYKKQRNICTKQLRKNKKKLL